MTLSQPDSSQPEVTAPIFLAQARGHQTDTVPVWFMRQAGRALPEYRAIRGTGSILEAVQKPELAAEITLQPVRRYGVDAAVLYSDIIVPVNAIDFGVEIRPGRGPIVEHPISSESDMKRFRALDPMSDMPYVIETIKLLKPELSVPLIGFAGAPFTVASYLIEGGPSKNFERTKALMFQEPELWDRIMSALSQLATEFLTAQLEAGVDAVQLFDSWAGALSPRHYRELVLPYTRRVFESIERFAVPRIHFGVGTSALISDMVDAPVEVLGLDWRVPISKATEQTRGQVALQGNLDPAICLSNWSTIETEARQILKEASTAPGFIFNLGHGVLPETDPGLLSDLVQFIHSQGRDLISANTEGS